MAISVLWKFPMLKPKYPKFFGSDNSAIACSRGKFYNVNIIIFNFHKNGINNIIFLKSPKVGKKSFRTAWHNYILACQKWQKMTFYDNGTFTYIVNFAVATLVRTTSRDISATGSISINLNNAFYTKIIKKNLFNFSKISHFLTSKDVFSSFSWLSDPLWQKWSVISNQTLKKSSYFLKEILDLNYL